MRHERAFTPVSTYQSTFLPAHALGCTSAEREAAIEVLHRLESGTIRSLTTQEYVFLRLINKQPKGDVLYMCEWCDAGHGPDSQCGTYCCLGGWIEVTLGHSMGETMLGNWQDVFYPRGWDGKNFSTTIAAKALRTKLETGKADWT